MSLIKNYNRRKFLNVAGLAAASGLLATKGWGAENQSVYSIGQGEKIDKAEINNAIATIIETKVICIEPGRHLNPNTGFILNTNGHLVAKNEKEMEPNRYLGWPTICKTTEGELIVVYSGDRDAHVCPWGKTQIIRSKDNGKTWTKPETITSTPLDDRDAGIIQTAKGTLLVSWFTSLAFANKNWNSAYQKYVRVSEKIPDETKKKWLGHWVRRSEDGGKTWLEPSRTVASAPHGPIQLRDGKLLYIGNGNWDDKPALVAEQSRDDGVSWEIIATLPRPEGSTAGISEPHLVELTSGKILAMFRHEPKDRDQCYLLQSESYDGGKTWAPLHRTGLWGYPPHLIELKNGWVLVVYGHRRERFSERACISRDEGETWDVENEIILTEAVNHDLGYPASTQLDDGSILTIYYQALKPGEPTCLMSTHWRLK